MRVFNRKRAPTTGINIIKGFNYRGDGCKPLHALSFSEVGVSVYAYLG